MRNYDLMILTETKILDSVYKNRCLGYYVACSWAVPTVDGGVKGGMGIITRDRPEGWDIESMQFHGQNMVIYRTISGLQQTPLIES